MPSIVRSLPWRPACFRKAVLQPIAAAVVTVVRPRTLALAIATPLVLLLSQQQAAKAVILTIDNVDYDVELYIGSYNDNASYFNLPSNGGRMAWWGNELLANDLAFQLAGGLSPTPPAGQGPLFATSFDSINVLVLASYFDLDTLGTTDTIIDGASFNPSTSYSWAVLVNNEPAPVPAPLPLLGAAAAFSASRRLRHRIHLARSPRP